MLNEYKLIARYVEFPGIVSSGEGVFQTDNNKKKIRNESCGSFFLNYIFKAVLKAHYNLSLFPVGLSIIRSLSLFTRVFFMGIFVSLRIFPV